MERLRLCMSLAWEKIMNLISKSSSIYSGWFEKLTRKATQYCTEHLENKCDGCGEKLIFDEEITTRKGETEWMMMICSGCGKPVKQMLVRD